MKITRLNRGYTIRLSNTEMETLRMLYATTNRPQVWWLSEARHRRSISRRGGFEGYLRTDEDRRTPEYKETNP